MGVTISQMPTTPELQVKFPGLFSSETGDVYYAASANSRLILVSKSDNEENPLIVMTSSYRTAGDLKPFYGTVKITNKP